MKRFLAILLMLSTTTLFAANGDTYRAVRLAQKVNVDGTTNTGPDYNWAQSSGDSSAFVQGVNVKSGEILAFTATVIVAAIGIGIGVTNKDPTRGNGHLTHADQRNI